jgi:glutamine amidotransferase
MVGIIDYGMGNLHSVLKACAQAGLSAALVATPEKIKRSSALILPGVGAFGKAMEQLCNLRLLDPILAHAHADKPLLGICLGMQLLFDVSYEFGKHRGLGLLPGEVLPFPKTRKVPHMGWNALALSRPNPFFEGVADGSYMYFVHSYYCRPQEKKDIAAKTRYGREFASSVIRKHLIGVQFHPEKSQILGLRLYTNFATLIKNKGEKP